ncbi:MAG TPA: DUF5701 family protein [Gaiellaceae bacterium]|nr:DUF5701 family protein [Gaiellaceae bacterium]
MNEIVVDKAELMSIEDTMRPLGGFVGMGPTTPADYSPIAEVEIPDTPAYRLLDVDTGADFFDIPPEDALPRILERGRSPLTIEEGVAVLAHEPEVLRVRNAFSLLGSRRGDRRVPALWISGGRPRLGWCWAGAPHSWLGAASCAQRVASD